MLNKDVVRRICIVLIDIQTEGPIEDVITAGNPVEAAVVNATAALVFEVAETSDLM